MKRYIINTFILLLVLTLLCGCSIIQTPYNNSKNTISDSMTIKSLDGKKIEIKDKEIQKCYLTVWDNKQKIEKKPGYLSNDNIYTVDYRIDDEQGNFEIYIEPSLIEVMIDLNGKITTEDIVYIVDNILSVTELEFEDLVFKDSFGLLLDAKLYGSGSYKTISFDYSKDGPFKVVNTNPPTVAGIAFTTTVSKQEACENTMNLTKNSCDGIKKVSYNTYDYPKKPEAILPHLYKSFIVDENENWYRISDSDIRFLLTQDVIYDSLKKNNY